LNALAVKSQACGRPAPVTVATGQQFRVLDRIVGNDRNLNTPIMSAEHFARAHKVLPENIPFIFSAISKVFFWPKGRFSLTPAPRQTLPQGRFDPLTTCRSPQNRNLNDCWLNNNSFLIKIG